MTPGSEPVADAAYQGAPGAFSEDAARALAGIGAVLLPCRTLEDVFTALAAGRAASAVVPTVNSIAGPIPRCARLLRQSRARVVGACALPIAQALVAPAATRLRDVRCVLSHPVALAQCGRFLRRHPRWRTEPWHDTAASVAEIVRRGRPDLAAIASVRAAEQWHARVLRRDIQDRADNTTRFVRVVLGG